MKLRWTQRARRDLIEIGRHIAQDKPMAARRWVERLRNRARDAAKLPLSGRRVPEVHREDVREVPSDEPDPWDRWEDPEPFARSRPSDGS